MAYDIPTKPELGGFPKSIYILNRSWTYVLNGMIYRGARIRSHPLRNGDITSEFDEIYKTLLWESWLGLREVLILVNL